MKSSWVGYGGYHQPLVLFSFFQARDKQFCNFFMKPVEFSVKMEGMHLIKVIPFMSPKMFCKTL